VSRGALSGTVVVCFLLCGACGPDTNGGECSVNAENTIPGELIDFVAFGHDFEAFCPGGFEAAESHARWVADIWGGEGEREAFKYGLFESRDDPCWPCDRFGASTAACALGGVVATTKLPHRHEISHAVKGTSCATLLEEGWATLYGDYYKAALTTGDIRVAAASVNEGGPLPGEYYPLAARFVAFLIETYGQAGFRRVCELDSNTMAAVDAAMVEVYGKSFSEIADEFDGYPEWSLSELRQDQACEDGELVSSPWTMSLDCAAQGVEGKLGVYLSSQVRFEVAEPGNYLIEFDAPVEAMLRLEIRSCERDGMASIFWDARFVYTHPGHEPSGQLFMNMAAGDYVLHLMLKDPDGPLSVDLNLTLESWP